MQSQDFGKTLVLSQLAGGVGLLHSCHSRFPLCMSSSIPTECPMFYLRCASLPYKGDRATKTNSSVVLTQSCWQVVAMAVPDVVLKGACTVS
eukprot:1045673-Amphidinium_carterae.2